MHNMSIMQILRLWSELEDAYRGTNGFGGNVAEIYAYTLHGHNPKANIDAMKSAEEMSHEAAESLVAVCCVFEEMRNAEIEVRAVGWLPIRELKAMIHREHIRVTPKDTV